MFQISLPLVMLLASIALASLSPTVTAADPIPCTATWQCGQNNDNIWASFECDADAGVCRCIEEAGFVSGAAAGVCSCPSTVTYVAGKPICGDITSMVAEKARDAELKAVTLKLYENLLFGGPTRIRSEYLRPASVAQQDWVANLTSLREVFDDAVVGRIDPVGTTGDIVSAADYFFGNPDSVAELSYVNSMEVLTMSASGNKVSVRVNTLWYAFDPAGSGEVVLQYNITQSGDFTFNAANRIVSYDLILHRLGKLSDPLLPSGPAFVGYICHLIMSPRAYGGSDCPAVLTPEQGMFANSSECAAYIGGLERGSFSNIPSLTQMCFYYHSTRAVINPEGHCTHVARENNPKCYYHAYNDYYKSNYN
eukprot:TRINITY_DN1310_c0_g1_i1.p1 TRINITY_DN1310_c0_g1~~TRINITY_DN1310_c0_g1_i1.p1  ORF type:complete len:366 (-),score=106.27 TRINITY_DN1310_c0_g1_i1:110-1207(-)